MNLGRVSRIFVLLSITAQAISAQAARPGTLVVHGKEFSFSLTEPDGWRGETATASKYDASIVFSPANQRSDSADVTIRVCVRKKIDEHIAALLAAETDSYRKKYPDVRCGDLMIDHPSYATYSKLCFVPRQFYDYISYINAGKDVADVFIIEMSVAKRPANENERTALDEIARTLRVIAPDK